jgi:hypothetical protein
MRVDLPLPEISREEEKNQDGNPHLNPLPTNRERNCDNVIVELDRGNQAGIDAGIVSLTLTLSLLSGRGNR